jgi:uncharacterized protein YjbI with pentapeptide repeats
MIKEKILNHMLTKNFCSFEPLLRPMLDLYVCGVEFSGQEFTSAMLEMREFEKCSFINCNFSNCNFTGLRFIDCVFDRCELTAAGINHTAWQTVQFTGCTMHDLNFAMADRLIFEVSFLECDLRRSKFYGLSLKRTVFDRCNLTAADFMATDLYRAVFNSCDLYRTVFLQADLREADFSTAMHYAIEPSKNKMKLAVFSRSGLSGLTGSYGVVVSYSGFSIT